MKADIVDRLRSWVHTVKAVSASDIMAEAADEIERLQLTDEEREAVAVAAESYASDHGERFAATLRSLLERTTKVSDE